MGLIKAISGAVGGVLADQWKEFFYCDALSADVLVRKGTKRVSGRSSNTKGSENIISNGSGIAVADGQRRSVGSSTIPTCTGAIASPTRSARNERPLRTSVPENASPTTDRNCAVTHGSNTTVRRWLGARPAPSRRTARPTRTTGTSPSWCWCSTWTASRT